MVGEQFEGRSAAEAAIAACESLGVSRSALKYEVLSDTGSDLSRRVLIRVLAVSTASEASRPVDDEPLPQLGRDAPAGDDAARAPRPDRPRRDDRGGRGPSGDRGGRGGPRGDRGDRGPRPDRGGRPERGAYGRDRDSGGRGDRDRNTRGPRLDARPASTIDSLLDLNAITVEPRVAWAQTPSERAAKAQTVLGEMLAKLALAATSVLVQDDEEIHFDIRGEGATKLTLQQGEALLAMQFLVNRMMSRSEDGNWVVLDASGYREKRRKALGQLAKTLAEKALEQDKVVRMSPMSAHDRRVFHLSLSEMQGVTTRSEGDGLYRSLLIIPSKYA